MRWTLLSANQLSNPLRMFPDKICSMVVACSATKSDNRVVALDWPTTLESKASDTAGSSCQREGCAETVGAKTRLPTAKHVKTILIKDFMVHLYNVDQIYARNLHPFPAGALAYDYLRITYVILNRTKSND